MPKNINDCFITCTIYLKQLASYTIYIAIGHFTVVCSVSWPLNTEARLAVTLFLLQTFLLFMCKSWYSRANKPVSMIIYV